MNQYAVIGNPIKHSKSPIIHAAFAEQENVTIKYERILTQKSEFINTVNEFFNHGGVGLNITVPFKVDAFKQCKEFNDYAQAAKAVNTLSVNESNQWVGANTDGIGLLRDLKNNIQLPINNKNILILGAGGATRGILLPLLHEHPYKITVANRTVNKSLELANAFNNAGNIYGCGYDQINTQPYDIVINATSASLNNDLPPVSEVVINQHTTCYDLAYSDEPTAFMRWAQKHGSSQTYDGLGMLVEQAAESYYIWRAFKPDTKAVISILRPTL